MKYAAIITRTEYIPGDERSIQAVGHGYPAHTVERTMFRKFADLDAVHAYAERQESSKYGKDNYIIIQYEELKVVKTVKVEISK